MDAFKSYTLPRDFHFKATDVPPPGALYVTPEDILVMMFQSSTNISSFNVSIRQLNKDGKIQTYNFTWRPPGDRSHFIQTSPLAEGFLLGVAVWPTLGPIQPGLVYATIGIRRGSDAIAFDNITMLLCQGYVVSNEILGWPTTPPYPAQAGPGFIRVNLPANPAAGAEVAIVVPNFVRWRVQSFRFFLTTSAVVATRNVQILVQSGASTVYSAFATGTQAASLGVAYSSRATGQPLAGSDNGEYFPWDSQFKLTSGMQIVTSTNNLQGGDQFSGIALMAEEWIET